MNLKCINILFPYSCSSLIGHHEDPQTITLGAGCQFRGTIAHEIMHLLGFFHEHTRQDRDQYITVYEDNILDGMLFTLEALTFGVVIVEDRKKKGGWGATHLVGFHSSQRIE